MSKEQRIRTASERGGLRFSEETMRDMQRGREASQPEAKKTPKAENLVAARVVFNPLDTIVGTATA